MKTLEERFNNKFIKSEGGCWLWIGAISSQGYGSIRVSNKTETASRVSYELFIGKIPYGLWVLHKCDVRHCVNPEHLFLGTVIDNSVDMTNKNRGNIIFRDKYNKTHCIRGHEFTEENTYRYEFNNPLHFRRVCRKCAIDKSSEEFKKRKRFVNNKNKEYCNHGHRFDSSNTKITNGQRRCSKCCSERALKYYYQKKEKK